MPILTAAEISFLQWLCDNDGQGDRLGNSWIGATDRLTKVGYVKVQVDSSSLDTVHYTLTKIGRAALDQLEPP
jgi:hypothetical protein